MPIFLWIDHFLDRFPTFGKKMKNGKENAPPPKKANMASIQRSLYLLNGRAICAVFVTNEKVYLCYIYKFQRYVEKVTMSKTQNVSGVSLVAEKLGWLQRIRIVVSQDLETECCEYFLENTPISRELFF